MKFTCTKENLANSLQLVSNVASKQSNLPILTHILLKVNDSTVELVGTNLEIAIKTTIRAKVDNSGSFAVPAKMLTDYVSLLSDEQVEIFQEGNELIVTSGRSKTKIKGSPADEFPVIPDIEEKHAYTLLVEPLKEALGSVVFAAAKNEIRPELAGVYFGFFTERYQGLVLAATDSYRLAEKKMSVSQGQDMFSCIVPARTVYEIAKVISSAKTENPESQVRLWVSENQIAIRFGNCELTSRLIDGTYPNYTQIIPTDFKTISTVPIDILVKNIKAASLFTTTGVNAVSFGLNVADMNMEVSSASSQTGEHASKIEAVTSGEENKILLNYRYVIDGLNQMDDDVSFKMNSKDAPCLLEPKGKEDYVYIVMPIRQ